VTPVVYDAGVLIAADRGERRIWAEHRVRLEAGFVPLVPAPVVAQASRSPRQAQLRQLLRGCEVVAFDEDAAHRVGKLLAATKTRDIADGAVVALAVARKADVRTEDEVDIRRLVSASRAKVRVVQGRAE
jgi:PIN domain